MAERAGHLRKFFACLEKKFKQLAPMSAARKEAENKKIYFGEIFLSFLMIIFRLRNKTEVH
jgi:hypothetical protein